MAGRGAGVTNEQVESVMRASRALVGITAASISTVDDVVTVPQLRVMMMIATRGAVNLAAVAAGLQVSASNASRICDRLLKIGMVDRRDDPADRRHIALTLTPDGQVLIDRVIHHRRIAIRQILREMPATQREALAMAFDAFATVAGEPREEHRHALI
ncbi:MarR family winged helix-turn-helix transcriptional regulator [Mycobacterium sp. 852014-52144_SCH5372336]|uniref:MarR family winged helix-turn-helix transcriptional regulator n=1 Tax=Mycobacterium sp. 852014-52144_SCH5372336 TaxID=1834115 RepID=UPI000801ECDB|nr:MarR family winged helix-turn-helix transcriptional regulator [Mycobacterium sp. 852014-52144_SCH5372336]OBB74149.1 MarR family transcriptional regulator [Mycobacterium sp. 852014-52144_SCH5372336]